MTYLSYGGVVMMIGVISVYVCVSGCVVPCSADRELFTMYFDFVSCRVAQFVDGSLTCVLRLPRVH